MGASRYIINRTQHTALELGKSSYHTIFPVYFRLTEQGLLDVGTTKILYSTSEFFGEICQLVPTISDTIVDELDQTQAEYIDYVVETVIKFCTTPSTLTIVLEDSYEDYSPVTASIYSNTTYKEISIIELYNCIRRLRTKQAIRGMLCIEDCNCKLCQAEALYLGIDGLKDRRDVVTAQLIELIKDCQKQGM